MFKIVQGNLLRSKCDVIAHQVNGLGIMGGGIAYQIKEENPCMFRMYYQTCKTKGMDYHGHCVILPADNNGYRWYNYVANLFGQRGIRRSLNDPIATDYVALETAINHMIDWAIKQKNVNTIGFPYGIGCGLAGGDWNIVSEILDFADKRCVESKKLDMAVYLRDNDVLIDKADRSRIVPSTDVGAG